LIRQTGVVLPKVLLSARNDGSNIAHIRISANSNFSSFLKFRVCQFFVGIMASIRLTIALCGNEKIGKIGVLDEQKVGHFRHFCRFNASFRTGLFLQNFAKKVKKVKNFAGIFVK
jgi:hypothetical protein